MFEPDELPGRGGVEYETFIVYAVQESGEGVDLTLPTKERSLANEATDAILSLVERAALDVSDADDGQHVAHVYVRRGDNAIIGFEVLEPFAILNSEGSEL